MNQFRCLRALKKEKEAMQAVNECLKRTTDETLLSELLSEALDVAVNLKGNGVKYAIAKLEMQ